MASTLYEFYGGKLPSIQERAKTYEAQGLGSASTYSGTYDQNVALLGKLQAAPAPQPAQTNTSTIPANTLNQSQQVMNIPPAPVEQQPDLTTLLADAMKLQNQQTPEQQKLAQQDQTLSGQLEQMILASGNQGARKAELEQQAGLPQLGQQLNEINNQIRAINSSAFAATQNAENRLAPTFAITGEQAAIERQKAVQTYGLAAASQALQGNIALAQDNIKRALDSEFSQIEAKTKYYEFALNRNRDLMDKEDQKKADALTIALRQYEQQVAEQKANKSDIYKVYLEAAKAQADNTTLQAIQNAKTPEQALAIASQAGIFKPEVETQVVQLDNGNAVLINKQTGEVVKNLGGAGGGAGGNKYTPAQNKTIDQINTGVSNNFSYKAVSSAMGFTNSVLASLSQQTGTGDIAAINQFQKVIDEGAVTRDQDVKLIQGAQSFVNSLKTKIKKLESGEQLSPELRQEMANAVVEIYKTKVNALKSDPYIGSQIDKAERNGISEEDTILGQLGSFGIAVSAQPDSQYIQEAQAAGIELTGQSNTTPQKSSSGIWSFLFGE
jgi:hypothetical protein